jgi:hypothetical protein
MRKDSRARAALRDGVAIAEGYHATRKGGRPPKYRTERGRRIVERQQACRERRSVTENPLANDTFHGSTEAEKQPLVISLLGELA